MHAALYRRISQPAPRGIGLATGEVAKKILRLAGVKDCWAFTNGKTKTVVNYARSVFNALQKNAETRIRQSERDELKIISGSIGPPAAKEEPVAENVEGA